MFQQIVLPTPEVNFQHFTRADAGLSFGRRRKRLCARTIVKPEFLSAGVQGPPKGPGSCRVFSCSPDLCEPYFEAFWYKMGLGKNTVDPFFIFFYIFFLGGRGRVPVAPPSGSAIAQSYLFLHCELSLTNCCRALWTVRLLIPHLRQVSASQMKPAATSRRKLKR